MNDALGELELRRAIQVVVLGYPDAMQAAAHSDLIALVAHSSPGNAFMKDRAASLGLCSFDIPVRMPEILICAWWHPRVDANPAQRWLRQSVISACKSAYPEE